MGETLGTLGEFGLVAALLARPVESAAVPLGPGDDAAVIAAPDGRVVVSTDMLIEGRHFRRDWSGAHDVGRKAAAQNLADIAAMGATPTALVVGFGAPADLPKAWALEFAEGLWAECEVVGASVVGGDVVRADRVVLGVTALGDLQGRVPVTRSGARPGDVVALCGRQGWAAAGLSVLSRGFRSPRMLVDAHRHPMPPYAAGVAAAVAGATAMIDISDGLVQDAGHIAIASGVVVALTSAALPIDEPLRETAAAFNVDPHVWILTGGDDHALLACFPSRTELPEGFVPIGTVGTGGPPGVLVDGRPYTGSGGHDHFR